MGERLSSIDAQVFVHSLKNYLIEYKSFIAKNEDVKKRKLSLEQTLRKCTIL